MEKVEIVLDRGCLKPKNSSQQDGMPAFIDLPHVPLACFHITWASLPFRCWKWHESHCSSHTPCAGTARALSLFLLPLLRHTECAY